MKFSKILKNFLSPSQPDITKSKSLLGWEPTVPLREGILPMVEDFRKRLRIPLGQEGKQAENIVGVAARYSQGGDGSHGQKH